MSDLLEYKCPCCGGAIEFNSTLQKMKCPYCDTEFDMETVKEFNEAAANQQSDELNWESASDNSWKEDEASGMSVYICQSCGGEIVADESTGASSCPFCGNPVVMSGKFSGTLRPDFIIPFKLDKKAAKEGLTKHLHGKILLPKVFKKENHIDEIKGVYVPFWLFDTDASADIRYHATKTRFWSDSDYDYTETSHAFRDTVIGYDSITPEDTRIQLKGGKTHYALFPVWLLSTTWKGNHYLFGMNGQTGKFVGNLPVDKGIFTKWFLGLTAGFSVAAYAITWLIHTFC